MNVISVSSTGTVYLFIGGTMVLICCQVETARKWALDHYGLAL